MKINIKIKTKSGRLTMNGKTYQELNENEKSFLNDLLKSAKLEDKIPA